MRESFHLSPQGLPIFEALGRWSLGSPGVTARVTVGSQGPLSGCRSVFLMGDLRSSVGHAFPCLWNAQALAEMSILENCRDINFEFAGMLGASICQAGRDSSAHSSNTIPPLWSWPETSARSRALMVVYIRVSVYLYTRVAEETRRCLYMMLLNL